MQREERQRWRKITEAKCEAKYKAKKRTGVSSAFIFSAPNYLTRGT